MRKALATCAVVLAVAWSIGAQAPAAPPFFFLQLSDPQFGMFTADKDFAQETANFEFAIATANRLKPAFVVVTGDQTCRQCRPDCQFCESLAGSIATFRYSAVIMTSRMCRHRRQWPRTPPVRSRRLHSRFPARKLC
jgi:hypothetical protein